MRINDSLLLEALSCFAYPIYSDELLLYLRSKWVDACFSLTSSGIVRVTLRGLLKFEKEIWPLQAPMLCPALTAQRREPILRLLTCSDWTLERRVVAHTTGRVRHLLITARLCELATDEAEGFADRALLLKLAADKARALPGVKVEHNRYEPVKWLALARELIDALSEEDERERTAAAERLSALPGFNPLWGVPESTPRGAGV